MENKGTPLNSSDSTVPPQLEFLVGRLPELYQPIYGHPEISGKISRVSKDRLAEIHQIYSALQKKFKRPLRVLDLGCAQGYISLSLAAKGAVVMGVDYLEENITVCKALTVEYPDYKAQFEVTKIEDFLSSIRQDQYDLVLGLSIFHHLVHEHGKETVTQWIADLGRKIKCGIFELALKSEPLYWAEKQPEKPQEILRDFAFVHEVNRYATHLSEIKRPMYFASNSIWYLDGKADYFKTWKYTSHSLVGNNFQESRQYFIGEKYITKLFSLDTASPLSAANKKEIQEEANFLRNPPPGFAHPRLVTYGMSDFQTWLVRELLPGQILSDLILENREFDAMQIIEDVLDQLCTLEAKNLYHNDLRTWNVLVMPDGRSVLIDYGDISNQKQDVVWPHNIFLSFLLFVHEVTTGILKPPFPQRHPFISPSNLPTPYQQWAMSIWTRPTNEWSFKLLREEYNKMQKNISKKTAGYKELAELSESGTMLWMRAMEQHFYTLNNSLQAAESRSQQLEIMLNAKESERQRLENALNNMENALNNKESDRRQLEIVLGSSQERINTLEHEAIEQKEEVQHWIGEDNHHQIELKSVYDSTSWKVTYPLRLIGGAARRILRTVLSYFLARSLFRRFAGGFFAYFPSLKSRLTIFAETNVRAEFLRAQTNSATLREIFPNLDTTRIDFDGQFKPTPPVIFPMKKGERKIYFYVDHTILCPVNTGMQRVTRRLGRWLLKAGEKVFFVKWEANRQQFIFLNQSELAYLSQWHGPILSDKDLQQYPKVSDNPIPVEKHEMEAGNWLVVPEVTHITYQPQPMTLDILVEAKRQGLKTAFIYYDALPLKHVDLGEMAPNHETYMQQLLLADLIVPISNWSARDLVSFLKVHEGATLTSKPRVTAIPLPGESQQVPRVTTPTTLGATTKLILSVGSIVPHKNQVALVHAFEHYCEVYPKTDWQLVLVGNLHPDLASEINQAIAQNSRIKYLQHVPDDQLDKLYRTCSFTVFPSIEEGFGLPILESLWYAKPCICANFGSMMEVAEGGGCLTINMRDTDELFHAITRLITETGLFEQLSQEAVKRSITTWMDYSQRFISILEEVSNPLNHLGLVFYWVDHTAIYPKNSGIQRVTRGLARALIEIGVKLIPIKWNEDNQRFYYPSEDELFHLARWNGPQPSEWSPWIDPAQATANDWILIPELTSYLQRTSLTDIKQYATVHKLRIAGIFFDAIPYKMQEMYPSEASYAHEQYMRGLNEFDLIMPISQFSRLDLISYLSATLLRTHSLEDRIQSCVLPGEFLESDRIMNIKDDVPSVIKILCVGTVEPRKNHLILLQAFSRIKEQTNKQIELIIVGNKSNPELADQVQKYIDTVPGIRWEKFVNDTQLRKMYAECDFTVYPSMEEGFGLPILESLWYARPCICRNYGAMAEVAKGGGCLMVETADPKALADAILRMIEDDMLRLKLAEEAVNRSFRTWHDYAREVATRMATERYTPLHQHLPEAIDQAEFYDQFVNLKPRPLLSICISTYNRAEWLSVSLKNLSRMLPNPSAEVEIVVCDNTSSDRTPDVVQPYLQRADFSYYRNPENVGMLGNLRVTAHHARGRYIWILGDDDLVKPGSIEKVLQVIHEHPHIALIYLNYAYTRQDDAKTVTDLDQFLNESTPIVSPGKDIVGLVKHICTESENFFTAIYCLVFRRDHALRAYTQNTEGRPFSTMLTCIPTTYYTLNFMMNEPAYWIGTPQVVVNLNVSWMKYASLWILERIPEVYDLAERLGADPRAVDRWREHTLPGVVHWFHEIYKDDPEENMKYFSPSRLTARMKHLETFPSRVQELRAIYENAYWSGHPGARILPSQVFFDRSEEQ